MSGCQRFEVGGEVVEREAGAAVEDDDRIGPLPDHAGEETDAVRGRNKDFPLRPGIGSPWSDPGRGATTPGRQEDGRGDEESDRIRHGSPPCEMNRRPQDNSEQAPSKHICTPYAMRSVSYGCSIQVCHERPRRRLA